MADESGSEYPTTKTTTTDKKGNKIAIIESGTTKHGPDKTVVIPQEVQGVKTRRKSSFLPKTSGHKDHAGEFPTTPHRRVKDRLTEYVSPVGGNSQNRSDRP